MAFSLIKKVLLTTGLLAGACGAHATIVLMHTSHGDIKVNLFDETTPATVTNFLSYVLDDSLGSNYNGALIHRSMPGFIMQSGGYYINEQELISPINKKNTVINEPMYSNVAGTIAMAKIGCQPDSATSEWFFNLDDNSSNLDTQNAGFTVFGQIMDDGTSQAALDALVALPRFNLGGVFSNMPLQDFTVENANNADPIELANFVTIDSITVADTNNDTASDLTIFENTLIDGFGADPQCTSPDSGGNLHWAFALLLAGLLLPVKRFK